MNDRLTVKVIALIEIFIGFVTLASLIVHSVLSLSTKPFNVFTFVLASSVTSAILGIGLLNHKDWARALLVFFSGYIILTKILIFMGLLDFSGEIFTHIPTGIKNSFSVLYHTLLILYLTRPRVRQLFCGRTK
jgi:hypothetical protein